MKGLKWLATLILGGSGMTLSAGSVSLNSFSESDTLTAAMAADIQEDTFCFEETEETTFHHDSPKGNPYKFKGTQLIAPGVMFCFGVAGLATPGLKNLNREIKDDLQKNNHHKIGIDNVTQFVPLAATYGLKLSGVKGLHDMVDCTIIYGTAYLLLGVTLFPMKDFIRSERPNMENDNSFPSGHTAIAFVGAEVLRREYWSVSPWIGVSGYLFAAATGFMRMYNNAHWLTDVVGGAGLGILCAEAAYWLYPAIAKRFFKKRYDANVFLAPQISSNRIGMAFEMSF